jgi:predicted ATPase
LRIIKVLAFSQKSNIYIFDEPELSLSIYWQSMLLDDILKYGRRFKTIIATQSPYMMNGNQIKYLLEVDQNE